MTKRPARPLPLVFCVLSLAVAPVEAGFAQDAGPSATTADPAPPRQPKPKRDKYGSPLDTLMTTRLWTEVPPARDFVTQTRPDVKTLDYAPLTGTEPDRPKPRDAANISALRAELEGDVVKNERKGRMLRPASKPRAKQRDAPRP